MKKKFVPGQRPPVNNDDREHVERMAVILVIGILGVAIVVAAVLTEVLK